jgi:hypothetical protein
MILRKAHIVILVIGAGLAGLSAAITLQEAGAEVRILEASDRPGGRVTSDHIDGYILDRGFQLINANYPEIKRLRVMGEVDFITAPRDVMVSLDDRKVVLGDPRNNPLSVLNLSTGSLLEKISILRYFSKAPSHNKSVEEELLAAGTGNLYHRVLRPFLEGVFLTSPALVSATTGREIIKSFISGKSGIPRMGVSKFSEALASRVDLIDYSTSVESLDGLTVHTQAQEIRAEAVIVATDLTTAAQLLDLREVPKTLGSTTWYHSVEAAPIDTANLIIDGLDRGPVINSVAISKVSRNYAPSGRELISTTTLLSVSESEVRRHLSLLWGASTTNWELIAKYEISSSLPLFGLHQEIATSSKISDGLYIAGDYRTAPSQNGALLSGRLAAQELLSNL